MMRIVFVLALCGSSVAFAGASVGLDGGPPRDTEPTGPAGGVSIIPGQPTKFWLNAGDALRPGEVLMARSNLCFATLQADGSLAVYSGGALATKGQLRWSSGKTGPATSFLIMQSDGNLVEYAGEPGAAGAVIWAHNAPRTTTAATRWQAVVSDDCILTVWDSASGGYLWTSTWGPARPLATGDIVTLANAAGGSLSAAPAEALAPSPNTSAWEQWEWVSSKRFVSFHGTSLMRGDSLSRAGKPSHAALVPDDETPSLQSIRPDGTLGPAGVLSVGQPFLILFGGRAISTTMDGTVDFTQNTMMMIDPRCHWIPRLAANVASGRTAEQRAFGSHTTEHALRFRDPGSPGAATSSADGSGRLGTVPVNQGFWWQTSGAPPRLGVASIRWADHTNVTNPTYSFGESPNLDGATGFPRSAFGRDAWENTMSVVAADPVGMTDRIVVGRRVAIRWNASGRYLTRTASGLLVWAPSLSEAGKWLIEK